MPIPEANFPWFELPADAAPAGGLDYTPDVTIARGVLLPAKLPIPADECLIVAADTRGPQFNTNPEAKAEPIEPVDSSAELQIISCSPGVPLAGGGTELKRLVEARVDGQSAAFIERSFKQRYIDNWRAFRQAGLNVPPELYQSDRSTLLVGDVKAGGSEVYGKSFEEQLYRETPFERPRPELDQHFLSVTDPQRFGEIEAAAFASADRALQHGIRLPFDDPFELLVRPDGSWDLITLDLLHAVLSEQPLTLSEQAGIRGDNERHAAEFLNNLQLIRPYLDV